MVVFDSVGISQMSRSLLQWSLRLVGALAILGLPLGYLVFFLPAAHAAHGEWSARFEREIYPLLLRGGEASCIRCHDQATSSELEFVGDARDDFQMLLAGGYFLPNRPDSLLSRIEAENPKRRMPKGDDAPLWTDAERELLRQFATSVSVGIDSEMDDEAFPVELLSPYRGERVTTPDTQFLSYTQLQGKIRSVFADDWVRNGVDQFKEHVALFGGADFDTRFNESSRASSAYLTALQRLAKDVAERAWVLRSGPFADEAFWSLAETDRMAAVGSLYRAVLFRDPAGEERDKAEDLYRSLAEEEAALSERGYDLQFQIEVTDPITGLVAEQLLTLPIRGGGFGVYQELIDQRIETEAPLARRELARRIGLSARDPGQALVIQTEGSNAPVSFAGVLLSEESGRTVEWIGVQDERVRLEGGWRLRERRGRWLAESDNEGDGNNRVVVLLQPDYTGDYKVTVYWQASESASSEVLTEVWHRGGESVLAERLTGPEMRDGVVQLSFDGTIDSRAHVDFDMAFQFGKEGYVEINNTNTEGKVAVGPVGFRAMGGPEFEVDTKEADGFDQWAPFKALSFNAYNRRGTRVEDQKKRKGELFLRYFPRARKDDGWVSENFYSVRVYYPGKRDHDPTIPVLVRAEASSPVIRLRRPPSAVVGSQVVLDASDSFTTQGSELSFQWRQVGGVPVDGVASGPRLSFDVPAANGDYHFWLALTQGLIRHPDFLFTRAASLDRELSERDRKSLQLSRLAIDLLGRAPTPEEVSRFRRGASWESMVSEYLQVPEFERFYQHRVRLYLESQGTTLQDEPVRLWCFVAFNDRPFQEILTAEYTVDEGMRQRPRPAYHGQTGVLTTAGFIAGKPGLPHYNYSAQVSMLFLGYRYEVPADIVEQREGVTPLGTTDPNSACYSCHKILTPLAFQRNFWSDDGKFRLHDEYGLPIESSDHGLVAEYPFKGEGLEAFALQAVKKERFIRTMIDTHFDFLFGRAMRYRTDERDLYRHLWDAVHEDGYTIRGLMKALAMSPAYRELELGAADTELAE